jgi:polar amino acid transport system permease protein
MIIASLASVWADHHADLLDGLVTSLKLTAVTLLLGYPLGLLLATAIMSGRRAVRAAGLLVVETGRGAPLLVLLYLMYFGLPQAGLTLEQFLAATITFAWFAGAYSSEVLRASLEAVPPGQREAAAALGLGRLDAFRSVVLPQAIRIAIPPLMSMSIQIFQSTSLAFAIAVPELSSAAYLAGSTTFEYLDVFLLAAALYAAICLPASMVIGLVERRLGRHLTSGS